MLINLIFNFFFIFIQSSWFRKSRFKSGKGKQLNVGGCGLGFRERPGMGSSVSTTTADLIKKCGPGSDRLSAIKATFKSQYLTQVILIFFNYFLMC